MTLGTMQVKNTPIGLMDRSIVRKDPEVRHKIKLLIPNTSPQKAPLLGPRIIAPTATGTVRKVIDRPGVRKYPKGVKDMMRIIDDIKANCAICLVLVTDC